MRILSMELTSKEKELWDKYLAGDVCEDTGRCRDCPFFANLDENDVLCKIAQCTEMTREIIVKVKRLEFKEGMDTSDLRLQGCANTEILAVYEDPSIHMLTFVCRYSGSTIYTVKYLKDEVHNYIGHKDAIGVQHI